MSQDLGPSAAFTTSTSQVDELARRLQGVLGEGYKVERPLGSGGFAVVYLVRDLTLKRDLAIKVLSPDLISTEAQLARFRREAEMIAGLSHPNIVPLHFIGERDGLFFLAMQCVSGGSLADRMKREQPMSVDEAIRALVDVANALSHAHKRGVVHRDIKPQNVLVDEETGRCLLTDFGIARGDDSGPLTATGIVVGTPAYLAPERIMGDPSDHRADIYAVGVMAYELLAGQPPFHGATPMAGMMRRLGGPPQPLHELRPDVPPSLEEVVNGCLATDPAERFQNASDVVRALTGATPTSGGHKTREAATRPKAPRTKSWVPLAAVGVVVAVALSAWLASEMRSPPAPPPRPAEPALDTSMAVIAGGNFTLGSDTGTPLSRPAHVVRVAPVALGRHEVTVGEFRVFADSTGARLPWQGTTPNPRLPVTGVLWSEAANYCAWRYKGGRLPTEQEWEAAVRGAAGRAYPWGNSFDGSAANTAAGRRDRLIAVGTLASGATPEGIVDLIGNVWEWTSSTLEAYPGAPALADTMRQFRVIRGGAFDTPTPYANAWHRGYNLPAASPAELEKTGFRCAMPLPAGDGR